MTGRKKRDDVIRHVAALPGGEHIVEHADGRLERIASGTDWERIDRATDDEIDAAAASDPDYVGFEGIDWSAVPASSPSKTAISIRVDHDVLDFFRKGGSGYQRRINAVLRAYVQATRKRA